jgi:hypothetical protein
MKLKVMFGNGEEVEVICDGKGRKNRIRKFRGFVSMKVE